MRSLALLISLSVAIAPATAQVTETPVPFDSAGRIVSVNMPLATRLALTPPAWPVSGDFNEARLYRTSTGSHTLAVTRPSGATDRYPLDQSQTEALRGAFSRGIGQAGRVVAEEAANFIAEPARGPFVRDQMLLATIIYGPSLATLTDDPSIGSGVYMLSVGGTFFSLNDFARRRTITTSQNSLTTDGALRGWAAMGLAAHAFGANLSEDGTAITALIGGIGGSMVGYDRGRRLTNSEAHSSMTGSTLLAGAVLGSATTLGIIGEEDDRLASAAVLTGGIAGYVLGPLYPRLSGYTITAGDVSLVRLGAILGTAAAVTPLVGFDEVDMKVAAGVATAGWVGGTIIADRIAAKQFNHSASDSRMVYLGALGGALMGGALPLMTQSTDELFAMSAITGGAILGSIVTQRAMNPVREGLVMRSPSSDANSARIELKPEGLLLAAMGQRGKHTLLRVRF